MSGFVDRENQIFETLQQFVDHDLEFVVVGGYAVSAFEHRFSVDVDVVIRSEDVERFTEILENDDFEEVADRAIDPYGGRYLAFEKNRVLPVTIDLLVDHLQCRQTDASWEYDYLVRHSSVAEIEGSERTVEVRVPEKELLVAVKLHSGRLTDARDAVALADDLELEELEKHLGRGDPDKLATVLGQVDDTIGSDDFEDAFKGVFQQGTLPEDDIRTIRRFIRERDRRNRR